MAWNFGLAEYSFAIFRGEDGQHDFEAFLEQSPAAQQRLSDKAWRKQWPLARVTFFGSAQAGQKPKPGHALKAFLEGLAERTVENPADPHLQEYTITLVPEDGAAVARKALMNGRRPI